MSLDAYTTRVFGRGKVTIDSDGIAVLACAWAIAGLTREMTACIEQPGGTGKVGVV